MKDFIMDVFIMLVIGLLATFVLQWCVNSIFDIEGRFFPYFVFTMFFLVDFK